MAAKRKSNATIAAEVLEERLEAQCERIDAIKDDVQNRSSELKVDIKEVLAAVNAMSLHVATLPSWDSVKQLHTETRNVVHELGTQVRVLEDAATKSKAQKKTLLAVAGLAGGSISAIVGWAMSYFQTPKSPHSP